MSVSIPLPDTSIQGFAKLCKKTVLIEFTKQMTGKLSNDIMNCRLLFPPECGGMEKEHGD
ncbi:hypothetical protein JCM17039_20870 [Blautia glucerasea]